MTIAGALPRLRATSYTLSGRGPFAVFAFSQRLPAQAGTRDLVQLSDKSITSIALPGRLRAQIIRSRMSTNVTARNSRSNDAAGGLGVMGGGPFPVLQRPG